MTIIIIVIVAAVTIIAAVTIAAAVKCWTRITLNL